MRVAIVHDWLNGMRGGEKVLDALLEIFPEAVLFTLFHQRGRVSPGIESHRIVTTWLDRVPGIYKHYRNLLPLFPSAIESLRIRDFDLVVSSSHAVAKGAITGSTLHVCYCHTPMRYIWDAHADYRFSRGRHAALQVLLPRLRAWDVATADRVDYFIANSAFVQDRIRRYYGRDSVVISPPIDTEFFCPSPSGEREDFYLAAGALVPYKRFDILIEAFNRLGRRLIIAGDGPEFRGLRRAAAENIEMRGWISDDALRQLYRSAKALILTAREDFGMTVVEAQSCGCPVIALQAGGALETVYPPVSGVFFAEQHSERLMEAVCRFETMTWSPREIRSRVERFSRDAFKDSIRKFVSGRLAERTEKRTRQDRLATQPA